MSTKNSRTKLVPCAAIPFITELNELLVTSRKRGVLAELNLPPLLDRAYYLFHETGVMPMVDQDSDEGT